MKFQVIIHKGPTSYGASVPDLPGVYAVGDTSEEVRELIVGAIDLHLRGLLADGESIPEPTHSELIEVAIN